jgi:predicted nucleotidyltransferase component of viral defense system
MLHWETVSENLKNIFEGISANEDFNNFYLVGGTALSLMYGHRISIDLDFFSPVEFYPTILSSLDYEYSVNLQNKNSVDIQISDVKVFFMYFAFQRYKKLRHFGKLRLADPIDIGLMKLIALQGRMTVKDVIDLIIIDKEVIQISKLLSIFDSMYSSEKMNKLENFSHLFDDSILLQPIPMLLRKDIDVESGIHYIRKAVIANYK